MIRRSPLASLPATPSGGSPFPNGKDIIAVFGGYYEGKILGSVEFYNTKTEKWEMRLSNGKIMNLPPYPFCHTQFGSWYYVCLVDSS